MNTVVQQSFTAEIRNIGLEHDAYQPQELTPCKNPGRALKTIT
jgi:hypothetical protein